MLSFEENIRQEKIIQEKERSETERKHNIQYASHRNWNNQFRNSFSSFKQKYNS